MLPSLIHVFNSRCSAICTSLSCDAWAIDGATGACRIYPGIHLYQTPVEDTDQNTKVYMPVDTPVRFVTRTPYVPYLTWNKADSECQKLGERMIYLDNEEALLDYFNRNGHFEFYMGAHRVSVWSLLERELSSQTYSNTLTL